MTKNQIEFAKLQEDKRSNSVREKETSRSNLANEELTRNRDFNNYLIARGTLENQKRAQQETERYNRVLDSLERSKQAETQRNNRVISAETNRANLARERENQRSNMRNESISATNATTSRMNASTNRFSALASASIQSAQVTNSLINTMETMRHNSATEAEINRHALVSESQNAIQLEINKFNAEANAKQAESSIRTVNERVRSDLANEDLTKRGQVINLLGSIARTIR